jgi:predicted MFS family arabinose efflux permease
MGKGLAALRGTPAVPILVAVALMTGLAIGLRQSIGLFMPPAVKDLGIAVADFTLAVAVQNLAWGILQPFAGALADKYGFRPVMLAGAVSYCLGLLLLSQATGVAMVILGAGVFVGLGLACTGSGLGLAVAARPVPLALRSTILGLVSAAGSLGSLVAAPIGQAVSVEIGWRGGVLAFLTLALVMLPAAWIAGRVDRVPVQKMAGEAGSARAALATAIRHPPYVIMSCAYFICGLQLVFLTTHLPSYLALCGMDPMLGAQALAVIGGFNIAGSLFFGWAGGRWSKPALLGCLYLCRSMVLLWYFATPPTPGMTLVFAALMGFLWLGVAPLVAGFTAEMFGLRWQAMIQGLSFSVHQIGSTLGAFGGGLLFDAFGDYVLAVQIGVGMGILAGTIQLLAALPKWPGPRAVRA